MDENIYKKVKDKLLNGIEISENDLRYIKLNANLLRKERLKRNGLHRNLESGNNNNLARGKSLSRNKRKIGGILKPFSNKGYSSKKVIAGTKWLNTRFVKAVWRRDWIHLDRD